MGLKYSHFLPFSCCLHSIIFLSLISCFAFSFFKFDLCHLSFSFSFCFSFSLSLCLVGVRTVRKSGCSWKVWTYTSYKRAHYSETSILILDSIICVTIFLQSIFIIFVQNPKKNSISFALFLIIDVIAGTVLNWIEFNLI